MKRQATNFWVAWLLVYLWTRVNLLVFLRTLILFAHQSSMIVYVLCSQALSICRHLPLFWSFAWRHWFITANICWTSCPKDILSWLHRFSEMSLWCWRCDRVWSLNHQLCIPLVYHPMFSSMLDLKILYTSLTSFPIRWLNEWNTSLNRMAWRLVTLTHSFFSLL